MKAPEKLFSQESGLSLEHFRNKTEQAIYVF